MCIETFSTSQVHLRGGGGRVFATPPRKLQIKTVVKLVINSSKNNIHVHVQCTCKYKIAIINQ